MKKISFLPLLALVLAVGASAFTAPEATDDAWYVFTGNDYADVDNRLLYERTSTGASPGCSKSGNICAIRLPDNGTTPDQTDFDALLPAIELAQTNGSTNHQQIEMED